MDPVIASLIEFWPWIAGGASSVFPLILYLLMRKTPEEIEEMKQKMEVERKERERQAEISRQLEERRAEEERQRREQERTEKARRQQEAERQHQQRLAHVVKEALSHITLTGKKVQVGFEHTSDRAVGIDLEEVPYPADHIDIRPIQNMGEIGSLLPTELALDDDMFYARLAGGDSSVLVHQEEIPIMEPVHTPVYEERKRILYGLLDRSPSMYPREFGRPGGEAWRKPVWIALTDALVEKTIQEDADLLWREFGGSVTDLIPCLDEHQKRSISTRVRANTPISSTNIGRAIRTAITDFDRREYDQAYILIITDGEDNNGTDWKQLRDLLDTRGIKLHAILLGVENEGLRTCAHVSQTITADLSIADLVHT